MTTDLAPEATRATIEASADARDDLRDIASHLRGAGLPGMAEKIERASRRLGALTQSYLDACADNDRLRDAVEFFTDPDCDCGWCRKGRAALEATNRESMMDRDDD